MLDPQRLIIEQAAQVKLVEKLNDLVIDRREGRYVKSQWKSLLYSARLLDSLSVKELLDADELKQLQFVYECLINSLNLNNLPTGIGVGDVIVTQPVVQVGIPGPQGPAGQSTYLYFAFADDIDGTGFTTTYSTEKPFLAFLRSTLPIITLTAESFAGKWIRILGEDGNPGTNGTNGTNGTDGLAGRTILSGFVDPTGADGVDGDFYINTLSWTIFGPKAAGAWPVGVSIIGATGAPGNDGLNGQTILNGVVDPDNGLGVDGDFYINTSTSFLFGPKAVTWPAGISLKGDAGDQGVPGLDGTDGQNGTSAYLYVGFADDENGNGFTITSDFNKNYIAFRSTDTILDPPIASDFTGLWHKFKGTGGDRWSTWSTSTLTIGTGTQYIAIEKDLAYVTGQRVVISVDGDFTNRMEGYIINYDRFTGQASVSIDFTEGSGTFSLWDMSLQSGTVPQLNVYEGASPTTITVGGIPAASAIYGLTYDQLWERLLVPYVLPTFATFLISGQSTTIEVGATISGTKTFTWTVTNAGNILANSIDIDDITGASNLVTGSAQDGTEDLDVGSVSKTSPASHTWRITGTDTNPAGATDFTRDFVVTWAWRKHWGPSTNTTLNAAQILALASSSLDTDIAGTLSFAGGGYKFMVFDDSLGSPAEFTGFKDTATGLSVAMATDEDDAFFANEENGWYYGIVSVTNAEGVVSDKRVYRTKNILGGAIDIQVSI